MTEYQLFISCLEAQGAGSLPPALIYSQNPPGENTVNSGLFLIQVIIWGLTEIPATAPRS